MREVLDTLLDADSFLEVHKRWAKELIVGYGRLDGRVVGHLLFSDLKIVADQSTVPALALAPLSVVKEHQRCGIGTAMLHTLWTKRT